jgi:hypothetical protein
MVGLDADCGAAFLPASAIDLDLISLHAARMALSILQNEGIADNYWLIRGRDFSPSEYPEIKGDFRNPFSQHPYKIPHNAECQTCRLGTDLNAKKTMA